MNPLATRVGFAFAVLGIGAAAGGCSTMKQAMQVIFSARLSECRGFDVPLSVFVGASRKELRARVLSRLVDHDFPFVVETNADSLVLVAFTPLGTKAFTLVRNGDSVEVVNLAGGPVTVPPRNVMEDVLAMSVPSQCATTPNGETVATFDGWQVTDTCGDGRPLRRHIAKTDAKPGAESEVEVEYAADAIVVRQNRCRYTARYVLQASAPAPPAQDGVSGAVEE